MKINKTVFALLSCVLLSGFLTTNAHAWDKIVGPAKVNIVGVGGKGGGYFRLEGSPALCHVTGSGHEFGWFYQPPLTDGINDRQGGSAMLALLAAAKLSGKSVTVFAMNAPGNWGCHVGYVEIQQ